MKAPNNGPAGGGAKKAHTVALNATDRYQIEQDAFEKGSLRVTLLGLVADVGGLRRDVHTIMWVLLPLASTALVLAAAAFIVAVTK